MPFGNCTYRQNSLTNGLAVVAEDPAKQCPDFRPTENEIINVCCFKMLNMWQFVTQQTNIHNYVYTIHLHCYLCS